MSVRVAAAVEAIRDEWAEPHLGGAWRGPQAFHLAVAKALEDITAAAQYGDWNTVHQALNNIADTYLT